MALWGTATVCTTAGYAVSIVNRIVYGTALQSNAWATAAVSSLALVSALCIFLAFFPPTMYRRWIAGTSE